MTPPDLELESGDEFIGDRVGYDDDAGENWDDTCECGRDADACAQADWSPTHADRHIDRGAVDDCDDCYGEGGCQS